MKNDNEEYISFVVKKIKRPFAVTIICLIGFLELLISIIYNQIFIVKDYYSTSYVSFILLLTMVCIIGLWNMKKLALYIYTGMFLINQFIMIYLGHWTLNSIVLPSFFIGIALFYLNKMD